MVAGNGHFWLAPAHRNEATSLDSMTVYRPSFGIQGSPLVLRLSGGGKWGWGVRASREAGDAFLVSYLRIAVLSFVQIWQCEGGHAGGRQAEIPIRHLAERVVFASVTNIRRQMTISRFLLQDSVSPPRLVVLPGDENPRPDDDEHRRGQLGGRPSQWAIQRPTIRNASLFCPHGGATLRATAPRTSVVGHTHRPGPRCALHDSAADISCTSGNEVSLKLNSGSRPFRA